MKHLLTQLGAAVIMLFALNINAQSGNCQATGCYPNDPGVSCTLNIHDCYDNPDCNQPNCPGFMCADLYDCTQYGWPCGQVTCTYCTGCAGPQAQLKGAKTHAQVLLARIRLRNCEHS